mgnify:CR=1 FL=1
MDDGIREKISDVLKKAGQMNLICEVYGESIKGVTIESYKGNVESMSFIDESGIGIRVCRNNKVGFAYTSDTSMSAMLDALKASADSLGVASELGVNPLQKIKDIASVDKRDNLLLYENLPDEFGIESKIAGVVAMEKSCYDEDSRIINTEGAVYEDIVVDVMIATSGLPPVEERRGFCFSSISAIASDGSDVESGLYFEQAQSPELIDFEGIGRKAVRKATEALGARQIRTGKYTVLIDEMSFAIILEFVESIMSGEQVAKGVSVLCDRLGERVASEVVTLIDDPHLRGGCFNAGFDAEGLWTQRRVLIQNGVLIGYLHNTFSALLLNQTPTANAVRSSYRFQPVPGATNLYIMGGKKGKDELISSIDRGVMVTEVMGLHTANSISGEFSFGISGFYVERGEIQHPISQMTVSGNIIDLFERIVDVGRDVRFIYSYGSPAVLVDGLSVGGE